MKIKHNNWFKTWLNKKNLIDEPNLSDFTELKAAIHTADIILVEGRSRVSRMIRKITQSQWTHSAIYIGTPAELKSSKYYYLIEKHWHGDEDTPLMLEGILGKGTVINPLDDYLLASIRICRPTWLTEADRQLVVDHVLSSTGTEYDLRQLFDLARFLMPFPLLPRRWRSSLFEHNTGATTKTVCSTLIAEAFEKVKYPILPESITTEDGSIHLNHGNPKLYIPAAYDYSPYFTVLKMPLQKISNESGYRELPWYKK